MHIVVIGAGASGILSAIYGKTKYNEITVLEREAIPLKKILKTGNGRCNYYNDYQSIECYNSSNIELVKDLITKENLDEVKKFFNNIGIIPKIKDGYYYPNSNQASSIRNALLLKVLELDIKIKTNYYVLKIEKVEDKFLIYSKDERIVADKVIISTGSYASFKEKSLINGYEILKKLGHNLNPILPALVQLRGRGDYFNEWKGIRCDSKISLYVNNKLIKEEFGEIQLTDYGISGICTFNISSMASISLYNKDEVHVLINFLPSINNITEFLENRAKILGNRLCIDFFEGVINNKLTKVLLKEANISMDKIYSNLDILEKQKIVNKLEKFKLEIIGTNDFLNSQVARGGVSLENINVKTMESLKIKNLYITGEVLDVDGICGGYNLTFCFISGMLAGRSVRIDKD